MVGLPVILGRRGGLPGRDVRLERLSRARLRVPAYAPFLRARPLLARAPASRSTFSNEGDGATVDLVSTSWSASPRRVWAGVMRRTGLL